MRIEAHETSRGPLLIVLLAIAMLIGAVAPTLSSLEFGRTLENLNIATALEARRDGHWLVPTLEGMPRTKKPPLEAWMTAAAMSPAMVVACSSRDPAVRAAAYRRLAWEARWPALVTAALAVLATYYLGSVIGGNCLGALGAIVFAGSYLFLRYAQVAVTDVPLTLWVILANGLFAAAVLEGRVWWGCVGCGAAVGLAFLSKGPVALAQTVAPWIMFVVWRRNWGGGGRVRWEAVMVGAATFVAVGVPWYVAVLWRDPERQWHTWFREVTGSDAPERAEKFYAYGGYLLYVMFPWVVFWVGGLWLAVRDLVPSASSSSSSASANHERGERFVFALMLVVVPVVIMSFHKDKKERYLLPLMGPAAVLTARCVMEHRSERERSAKQDWVPWVYWGGLAVVGLGLPIVGAMGIKGMKTVEGRAWYSPAYAVGAAGIALGLLIVGLWAERRRRGGTVLVTFALMLVCCDVFMHGYRQTNNGRSVMRPLAERIWEKYPEAELYTSLPRGQRASVDLSIYANRTTRWITEQEMLQPLAAGARGQVVVVKQREGEPALQPPEGWEEVMVVGKEQGDGWRAWGRPATGR
jgi:4-amino-4-deoxy-L-arabinose transferase-like glycosyltransferase